MWVPMFSISSFPRWPEIFFGCSQALPSWQGWASLLPFFPSHPSGLEKVQTLVAKWWISVCDISHFIRLCPWRKGPSSRFLLGEPGNLEKGTETKKFDYHCLKMELLEMKRACRWVWPWPSAGSIGLCLLSNGWFWVGWHRRHRSD